MSTTSRERYKRIKPARPLEQTDKVEVVDVFWYGCPHCYHFLPLLEEWQAGKPDYVEFKRVPAIFADSWAVHARAYYTARVPGLMGGCIPPFSMLSTGEKRSLNTKQELMTFLPNTGSVRKIFSATFDSFSVDAMAANHKSCRDVGVSPGLHR